MSVTRDPGSAPRRSNLSQTLIAPIALLALLVAMSVFLAITHLAMLRQTRFWVNHSHQVIETTQALMIEVLNVESGQRGYMLSHDERYLDYFNSGQAALPALMTRLQDLVAHNPEQRARVDRLIATTRQRVAISRMRVELIRAGKPDDAKTVSYLAGKASMGRARAAVDDIMNAEDALLEQRTAAADRAELFGLLIAMVVSALALAGLGASLWSTAVANRRLAYEISEREGAEAAQRESQALYRAIFANTADYLFVIEVSREGAYTVGELNPAFERATGITTVAARGRGLSAVMPRRVADSLTAIYDDVVAAGEPMLSRKPYPMPNGERVWESVYVPMRGAQGAIERIVGSARDVTEREQAEEQLRRAQRMEAIGHLTGGVAHDFNNLLQVIRGNLELIAPDLTDREIAAQRLKNALRGADRAAQLTRQLLAFARRQPLEPKVVNLGRMIDEIADMLRRTLGEAVTVETTVADGLWNTLADPAQVESALLNLAINARDAMPGGGRLSIAITNAALDARSLLGSSDLEPGDYVLIEVADTGHGMAPDVAARVFEPFFTTKGEEKGTGLGLSMVYGFVKQSNGHIQIQSAVGQGTTLKIFLPRADLAESVAEAAPSPSFEGRAAVILVVEDDDLVRMSSVGLLRDLGYTCLHASDGAAALEMLRDAGKVDLLFTDVVMPGPITSGDLAREAQRMQPNLPVLFTSGYSKDAIIHDGRLDPGVQLLSKPYSRDVLAQKIRSLLGRSRPVVLVVEDDALVRMSALDMIGELGFETQAAGDAAAALEILRGDGRIDVLFTDIGLPGMRGPELADAAVALRPGLKVIFASGYADAGAATAIEDAGQLVKPYTQDDLAGVLGAAAG